MIAPDLRGYGASPVVPGMTPLETFAQDIEALLDDLGIERFVLGGLSMGGQIVMECYRLFPERIRGLVLADTFPAAETPEGRAARHAMADRLLREGMRGYADEVLDKMVAPAHLAHGRSRRPRPAHDDGHAARGRRGGPARPRRTPRLPRPADPGHRPGPGGRRRRRHLHARDRRPGHARAAPGLHPGGHRAGGPSAEPGAAGGLQRRAGGVPRLPAEIGRRERSSHHRGRNPPGGGSGVHPLPHTPTPPGPNGVTQP